MVQLFIPGPGLITLPIAEAVEIPRLFKER